MSTSRKPRYLLCVKNPGYETSLERPHDGRWWSGALSQSSGLIQGNAIYEVATGKQRPLSDDAVGYYLVWLPGSTRVV